jgi:putative nucleotidyltransferase with HDIG domain
MLLKLRQTKQSPKYHPEGSAWNHTMLVIDEAAKLKVRSKNPNAFMWAALLHDIGKPVTTRIRKGKITSYDHEKIGEKLAGEFLRTFTDDDRFIKEVNSLVRWHMQMLFVVKNLPFADIEEMKHEVDIQEIGLLGLCDRLGRLRADKEKEEQDMRLFLKKCN